jgi:hypothetical protein
VLEGAMILPTYNILDSITSGDENINLISPFPFYQDMFTVCNNEIEERSFEIQEKLIKANNEKQLII